MTPAVDTDGDGIISFEEAGAVKAIEIGFEYEEDATPEKCVTDISGLEHFSSLETLNLKYHEVSDASPVEGLSTLTALNLGENPIKSLDLTKLGNLTDLRLYGTGIEDLDLASSPLITQLYLQRTNLKEIDLTPLTALENVFMSKSMLLSKIKASGLENVTRIDAVECNISEAEISDCPLLMELHLSSNKLSSIELTGLSKLMRLNLYDNQLKSLDVTGLPFLMWLFAFDNQISSIDFSGNEAIRTVSISGNPLKTLDLGGNPEVEIVEAENMPALELINLKNWGYSEWAEYYISDGNTSLKKVVTDTGAEFEHVSRLFKNNPAVTVTAE